MNVFLTQTRIWSPSISRCISTNSLSIAHLHLTLTQSVLLIQSVRGQKVVTYVMSIFHGLNNNVNLPYINRRSKNAKCIKRFLNWMNLSLIRIMIPESYSPLQKIKHLLQCYISRGFIWVAIWPTYKFQGIFSNCCVEKDIATQNLRLWLLPFIQKTWNISNNNILLCWVILFHTFLLLNSK